MIFGYARVSTTDQNPDLQINALKKAGCETILEERQSSIKDRPILNKLLQDLRKGDTLVVWKFDRLCRSLSHFLSIIEFLKKKEVTFKSISEELDTSTPIGRFYLQINGAYAELERNLISERTKAGLAAAVKRGVKLGRRKGLTTEAERKASAAVTLYKQTDLSPHDIAKTLGISTATLYRYLKAKNIHLKNNLGRKKN